MVQLITSNKLGDILRVPPEMGEPRKHHLTSTKSDNLIELSGRVCYDSLKQEKSRSSIDYHQHIIDVNHGSVQEHVHLVFRIKWGSFPLTKEEVALCLINRPGTFLYENSIVANIRAIREWYKFENKFANTRQDQCLGYTLRKLAKIACPLAMGEILEVDTLFSGIRLDDPKEPDEYWYSFYINNVSRGLTHELVRHKFQTAVSQRSTRYVDESESDWALHPLIEKYKVITDNDQIYPGDTDKRIGAIDRFIKQCQDFYKTKAEDVERSLMSEGVDKFTARKQARGAARGFLGNALSTELIFSASLPQWKRIISMRMSEHADAEIRLMAEEVYNILKELHPDYFDFVVGTCPDGIGQGIK